MNIYVGNLPYELSDEALRDAFAVHGHVDSAKIIVDRDTGRSKGFGFVDMPSQFEAERAIGNLDGSTLGGRDIRVNQARPRRTGHRRRGGGWRG